MPESAPPTAAEQDAAEKRAAAGARLRAALANILARDQDGPDRPCPCCGDSSQGRQTRAHQCMFSGLDLSRLECPACGLVFGPLPLIDAPPEELAALYRHLYNGWDEGDSRFAQEKTFYLLNPSPQKKYINYACGDWDHGIARLRELGWNVVGYEPFQPNNSPHIASEPGDPILAGCDGLFTHNYLEHVQDPAAFFAECLRFIKPGGIIAHSTPCYGYHFAQSPFHLFFFLGDSAPALAARFGLRQTRRYQSDNSPETIGFLYECRVFEHTDRRNTDAKEPCP